MTQAPSGVLGDKKLEEKFDLKGKSLDLVLFATTVPTQIPQTIVVALKAVPMKASAVREDSHVTKVLEGLIKGSYDELCQKITELRSFDKFDASVRQPLPNFEAVWGRITFDNFNVIELLQAVLGLDLKLVMPKHLTNAGFIYLAERWSAILVCNELLKEMLAPVAQRKRMLEILGATTSSVSEVRLTEAQRPLPLQGIAKADSPDKSGMRAPTMAGNAQGPRLEEDAASRALTRPLPYAKFKRQDDTPEARAATVRLPAKSGSLSLLPTLQRARPGNEEDVLTLKRPAASGLAARSVAGVSAPLFVSPAHPKDVGGDDVSNVGNSQPVVDAPNVVNGTLNDTPIVPTNKDLQPSRMPSWVPFVPFVGAVGLLAGLGISRIPQKPSAPLHASMPSSATVVPAERPVPPTPPRLNTALISAPQAPLHVPVVPFTAGVSASVSSAIRRSMIANHATTLPCVPPDSTNRALDFRYFLDGVTHVAATTSPIARSWRFSGDARQLSTTLDSMSPDCRTFAFTLYRGDTIEVHSTEVNVTSMPRDLIAARRRGGRQPTVLPARIYINFAQ